MAQRSQSGRFADAKRCFKERTRVAIMNQNPSFPSEQAALLDLIRGVTAHAIFTMDLQGCITTWNIGAEQMFGYKAEEMLGKSYACLFTPEDQAEHVLKTVLCRAQASGTVENECWQRRKDGRHVWASGTLSAIRVASGAVCGYCGILRDRTKQQREDECLRQNYERAHRIAEALQRAMLVPVEENAFPGLKTKSFYEAALDEADVGGDFFDAFVLGKGMVAFAVGDASGKGLAAAGRTTEVKDALRAFLRSFKTANVAQMLAQLNDFLCESKHLESRSQENFLCLTLAILDTESGALTWGTAGMEPPVIVRGAKVTPITPQSNMPLGILPRQRYDVVTDRLASNDALLLFTDGLTEARNGGALLGYDGLVEIVSRSSVSPAPDALGRQILTEARAFAGGAFHDDVCLLIARRL